MKCYVLCCVMCIQVARGVCNFYCSVLLCHVMGCCVECSAVYNVVKCNVERIALYNAMQCIVAACIVEYFMYNEVLCVMLCYVQYKLQGGFATCIVVYCCVM